MELEKQNVLFFTRTMYLGGTENVILQLCEILKPHVNKIVVCSCGGVNVERLTAMGIKHYTIPDIEQKFPKVLLTVCKTLKKIVDTEHITTIHTHHRMAAFYVSLMKLYKKCRFINTSHNTFFSKKILTKFSYKNANLVACGEMVKKNLVEYFGLPDRQVTVIHNTVKPFGDCPTPDKTISSLHDNGCFVVGNIGRLSEQKGMEYYIKAVPELVRKFPVMRFLIIGSGEDEQKLKQLCDELNMNDYIIFMGYRNDIQNIMSQLDLVVLSSLWEGLPLTPIEAFSVSKTIVATAVDGTVEVVTDGMNGFLVEPKNSRQIADKIEQLYQNDTRRASFEHNAFVTYENKFSFKQFGTQYTEYYQNIM